MNNKLQEMNVKVTELDAIRSKQQKKISQLKDQVCINSLNIKIYSQWLN